MYLYISEEFVQLYRRCSENAMVYKRVILVYACGQKMQPLKSYIVISAQFEVLQLLLNYA